LIDSPPLPQVEREHRFIPGREDAERFMATVAPHMYLEVYDDARPVAYTRTTYFDTDDLDYFASCGSAVKRRLRIREYAAAVDDSEVPVLSGVSSLELKESSGSVRSKARVRGAPQVLAAAVRDLHSLAAPDRDALESQPAFSALKKRLLEGVRARLTTWYRRVSLVAEKGRLRVTMDEGILFCQPVEIGDHGASGEPRDVVGQGPSRVIEVKYVGEPPVWLTEAFHGLKESPTFSKFCVGMRTLERAAEMPHRLDQTRPIPVPSFSRVRKP
jgi:hypothetical protein